LDRVHSAAASGPAFFVTFTFFKKDNRAAAFPSDAQLFNLASHFAKRIKKGE
jgi:hypothetical protein